MLLFSWALLKGKRDVNIFNKRIPSGIVNKAFVLSLMAILLVTLDLVILTTTEKTSFLKILFEIVSAFGTVGLSTGITSSLSTIGKIIISITMLVGRVGPLAIGFSLIGRPKWAAFRYTEEEVFVG